MKNKVTRDWISITLCPFLLWIISCYIYYGFKKHFCIYALGFLYSYSRYIFLMISAIIMARMVNLSNQIYESIWIFPITLVQLVPMIILLLYPTGLFPLPMYFLENARISFLLAGTSIFNIIKAFCIQRKKRITSIKQTE